MSFADLRAIDVYAAARRTRHAVRRTPLRRSAALSAIVGGDVYLKLENEQVTGSFKLRGAFNSLAMLTAEVRERGIVAASAGNHGLGVAWSARHFGISATVFVPSGAPRVKREGIAALGATVNADQPHYDAAHEAAIAFASRRGARFVDPCAGADLLAGQGTVALEIVEELPEVAAVITPIGGGGLLGGIASFLRRVAPHVRIAGAQTERTNAMARSLAADRVVPIDNLPTIADGLAGQIDEYGLDIGRHALDEIVALPEDDVEAAIAWLAREEQVVAEGAGAVGVAAMIGGRLASLVAPIAIVVSGGNIDPARHAQLLRSHARV
jgi:threonine dehydratase